MEFLYIIILYEEIPMNTIEITLFYSCVHGCALGSVNYACYEFSN